MTRDPRPLLVGQAPSRNSDPDLPLLLGRSGTRLQQAAGLELLEYAAAFRRINLFHDWPGSAGKGDRFAMAEARRRAVELLREVVRPGDMVVLVGAAVADAFGLDRSSHPAAEVLELDGVLVAWVPHPSGINLAWNDSATVARVGALLGGLARGVLGAATREQVRAWVRETFEARRRRLRGEREGFTLLGPGGSRGEEGPEAGAVNLEEPDRREGRDRGRGRRPEPDELSDAPA